MEIKPAPTPKDSQVLKSASKSNMVTLGLFGIGAALAIGWSFTPEKYKSTIISVGGIALGGGLTAIRFYNKSIEDGRIDIGDLDPLVATRALFNNFETGRLALVRDFVEGKVDLPQLGAVKDAIAYQSSVKPSMHEQVRELAARQRDPADFDKVIVSRRPDFSHLPPTQITEGMGLAPVDLGQRILDPAWEAPV